MNDKPTKPLTMDWKVDVTTKEYYHRLVDSGMAWEFYPSLPGSWDEVEKVLKGEKEDGSEC